MLSLKRINKRYRIGASEQPVLNDVSFELAEGEFVSIMGPSGSGKSSLLAVLGLLHADWQGEYHFAGVALHAMKDAQRKEFARSRIGLVFQHYHLLDDLNVAENIDLPLDYLGVARNERRVRVEEALSRFGLLDKRAHYPRQLSGGQQQMVAVARAVATKPRLLLADEPTGALHSSQGEMIMDLLVDLNRAGTSIIQVTHNPDYAARAGRVLQMRDGHLRTSI